jgi:hypothetical protein
VRKSVLEGLRGQQVRVYLFGSAAKGLAGPGSDIDVAVLSLKPLPVGLLSSVRERLEESTIPYKVDLVDLARTAPAFWKQVQREGLPWNG